MKNKFVEKLNNLDDYLKSIDCVSEVKSKLVVEDNKISVISFLKLKYFGVELLLELDDINLFTLEIKNGLFTDWDFDEFYQQLEVIKKHTDTIIDKMKDVIWSKL